MAKQDSDMGEGSVRLLIFSGRPDPEWSLDEGQLKELTELLTAALGGQKIHPPPEGGLGYRGFLLRDVPVDDKPSEVSVFRRVITERRRGRETHWLDTSGVEDWLLEVARRQGHGDALDWAGANPE